MKKAQFCRLSVCALIIATTVIILTGWPSLSVRADLKELTNSEMAGITGTGFSSFTVDGGRILAEFNILAETYTEIDSLKMGYWDNGAGIGWDQNWTNVMLGNAIQDMAMRRFFIEAFFENLDDPANRRLTEFFIGFRDVSGPLSGDFQSLSKIGVAGEPDMSRLNLGGRTFQFNNSEFSFSFQLEGPQRGIWVRFGEGTTLQ